MTKEKESCWFCHRTDEALGNWAKSHADKKISSIANMISETIEACGSCLIPIELFDFKKSTVYICPVCQEAVLCVCKSEEMETWLDEVLEKHYVVKSQIEYVEKKGKSQT